MGFIGTAFTSLHEDWCWHPASQPVQPPQCIAKRPESVCHIVLLLESQQSFVSVLSPVVLYRIHTLCCIFSLTKFVHIVPAILEQSFRPPHLLHCIFRQRWKMADLTGNNEGPSPEWGLGLAWDQTNFVRRQC